MGYIEDGTIQLLDGKMHYQSLGSGPSVVLLHSMAGSLWSWHKVMRPLAEGHTVYAVDTMGQGDSDKPAREYSIEDYAASVVDFMKARGIGRTSLIGNSVGAVFAIQIAAANQTMIDKVVLVGCPCFETDEERNDAMANSMTSYDSGGMPLPRSLEDLKQHYVNINVELQNRVNDDRAKAGIWAWNCLNAMYSFDILSALEKVKAVTLIMNGEHDMPLVRSKEEALNRRIKGSRLAIVAGSGHLPQMDNPEAFLEVVLPFLK
jgi:pimeloyl-ACP methyl ester carboxylesterase